MSIRSIWPTHPAAACPPTIVRWKCACIVMIQMVAGARQLAESHGLGEADVLGVGIGSPGPINIAKGLVVAMPNISGMDNCPLRDMVSEGLSLPATLENDANAAAYGEYVCGAGKEAGDMVMLTLGTGVGGGVVIGGGEILHGRAASVAEGRGDHAILDIDAGHVIALCVTRICSEPESDAIGGCGSAVVEGFHDLRLHAVHEIEAFGDLRPNGVALIGWYGNRGQDADDCDNNHQLYESIAAGCGSFSHEHPLGVSWHRSR